MVNQKKRSKLDFHKDKLNELDRDWCYLRNIHRFPYQNPTEYYTRNDGKGWWMPIKQIGFRGYINAYLSILGKNKRRKLYFIDPLSSYGMVKVTKNAGKDIFIFPGTSLNAALISQRKSKGFDALYINDEDPIKRRVLNQRIIALKSYSQQNYKLMLDVGDRKIDSNDWLINILEKIDNENNFYHALIIIDNQAMDISYNTLRKVRHINEFSDIIITFQDANIARAISSQTPKIENFFGCQISPTIHSIRKVICDVYCNQLSKIGLSKIEKMKVMAQNKFFYTLLFCCRDSATGEWLKMVNYYNNIRFRSVTDLYVKNTWDIKEKKQATITDYWNNCKL